ncbi:MAG: hypothetical protein RQ752_12600 [Thermohalobaculum sp.]|nr:hypothetical protein [Thermohalobaculum sp.]
MQSFLLDVGRDGGTGIVGIDTGAVLRLSSDAGAFGNPLYAGEAGLAGFGRAGGCGVLRVSSGGQLLIENTDGVSDTPILRFGRDGGSVGTARISGAGSSVDVIQHGAQGDNYFGGAILNIGEGGQGIVTVTDGAQINVLGDQALLQIARGRNGAADSVESQLDITNGGVVNGFFFDIGRGYGSDGRVLVDGVGSTLNASDMFGAFPDFVGEAGFLRLGRNAGSHGRLDVTNGGTVNVTNDPSGSYDTPQIVLARDNGARGVLVVDGAGSSLTVAQTGSSGEFFYEGATIEIGEGGQGIATVSNGATISVLGDAAKIRVASGRYDDNTAEQSLLSILGGAQVTVDAQGYGVVTPLAGGYDTMFHGALVSIGGQQGTNGRLLVDGTGSMLTLTSTGATAFGSGLIIGDGGTGVLDITAGGQVRNLGIGGTTTVGLEPGASGTVNIDGGDGSDLLLGGNGTDALDGGFDRLEGGAGIDTLDGGFGTDILLGGADADTFLFTSDADGADRVLDFEDGIDRIQFTGITDVAGFGDLVIAAQGTDTLVTAGSVSVLLEGVDLALIEADNFLFGTVT